MNDDDDDDEDWSSYKNNGKGKNKTFYLLVRWILSFIVIVINRNEWNVKKGKFEKNLTLSTKCSENWWQKRRRKKLKGKNCR